MVVMVPSAAPRTQPSTPSRVKVSSGLKVAFGPPTSTTASGRTVRTTLTMARQDRRLVS